MITEMIGGQPSATLTEPLAAAWMVEYRLALRAGRRVVDQVRVFPREEVPRRGVTRRLLRMVPMSNHLDRAADVARPLLDHLHRLAATSKVDTAAIRRQIELLAAPSPGRQPSRTRAQGAGAGAGRGRPPLTDEVLVDATRIYYNALRQHRPPIGAIVKETGMSRARAADLVVRARRRGFLSGTDQGVRGGRLTDEYRRAARRLRR
jgi:hypothetical protein